MEIILVRHGQKMKGEDPSLTEIGTKQVKRLTRRFKKEQFDEIYCSDMKRAIQTAIILGKKLSLKPKITSSLREFEVEVLKKNKKDWNPILIKKYEELKHFLEYLTKDPNSKKRVLIVAHGNTNRLIMTILLDLELKNIVRFGQLETAVNEIYWLDKFNNWRLRRWNDINHLPIKLRNFLKEY